MSSKIHFISGLPRAGTTLLAAILRQNPRFQASISTPLAPLLSDLIKGMSFHEASQFISDEQRSRIVSSVIESYWSQFTGKELIFDTNRMWCAMLPAIARLRPEARVICCVRSPAWIADSIERLVQGNPLQLSKIFASDKDIGNVYTRYDLLFKTGLVGHSIRNLRQAWFGDFANRMIVLRYDSLVARPAEVVSKLYTLLAQPQFKHDFDHVEYDEPEFDARLSTPGLHRVSGRVAPRPRQPILPPDLFKLNHAEFWNEKDENPHGVTVL